MREKRSTSWACESVLYSGVVVFFAESTVGKEVTAEEDEDVGW
jgi:hypothetical protein